MARSTSKPKPTDRQTRQSLRKDTTQLSQASATPAVQRPKPRPAPAKVASESSDEDELSSQKASQSAVEDDNNSDLENLDGKSLRRQLFSEQVKVAAITSRRSALLSDNEYEKPYANDDGLFLSDNAETDNMKMEHDELDSTDSACEDPTHRDKARRSEVPHFRRTQAKSKPIVRHPHHRHTVHATQSGDDDDDDDNDNKHVANRRDVNKGWPKEAHYEPIVSPARTLGIKNQPFPLRAVVKAAIKHVTGDIIFDSAYPSADLNNFNKYHRQVLIESARSLSYNHLAGRFKKDDELLKLIAGVVNCSDSRLSVYSHN
ncbi:hypothetical protein BDN71DRAFT_1500221 [Pleurotus eryngii]|uniref:Uncharacterized protein n=1 Tax=Pleurotus eryngii TaxID=5323 RepID=A0A9P6A8F7_PLEER|nr:hypothetical protein BDN71DRAFT_1500221 [Pleurotus eryngii]